MCEVYIWHCSLWNFLLGLIWRDFVLFILGVWDMRSLFAITLSTLVPILVPRASRHLYLSCEVWFCWQPTSVNTLQQHVRTDWAPTVPCVPTPFHILPHSWLLWGYLLVMCTLGLQAIMNSTSPLWSFCWILASYQSCFCILDICACFLSVQLWDNHL